MKIYVFLFFGLISNQLLCDPTLLCNKTKDLTLAKSNSESAKDKKSKRNTSQLHKNPHSKSEHDEDATGSFIRRSYDGSANLDKIEQGLIALDTEK